MVRRYPKLRFRSMEGAGEPPLAFLHGFPLDGRMWEPQLPLSGIRSLLIPDLPGFGESEPFTGIFDFDDMAGAVEAGLSERNCGKIVLCGLSMGCTLAVAFAASYPDRLSALLLVDGRAGGETPEGKEARSRYVEQVRSDGTSVLVRDYLRRLITPESRIANPALEGTLRRIMTDQNPEAVARTLEAMRDRRDHAGDLKGIPCPTLLLVGGEDPFVSPAEMRAMAEEIPEARLVVIPGVGHMSNMEAPGVFNRLVVAFLQGLEKRSGEDE